MSCYFIEEVNINTAQAMTAGFKARQDVDVIVRMLGFEELQVIQTINLGPKPNTWQKIHRRVVSKDDWQRALCILQSDDIVFLQLPIRNHSMQVAQYLKELATTKHIRLILLAHDLETFRVANIDTTKALRQRELLNEERTLLESCSNLILHNEQMRLAVKEQLGPEVYKKSVSLELFDYLIGDIQITPPTNKDAGIIVAGNLEKRKAGYIYHLPEDTQFNLYGVNYTGTDGQNIKYHGAYSPEDLPTEMIGSFGLVWDGPSSSTCSDVWGEYLRINNPHKASLYLACGIPIIIWDQAALAPFVIEHGVGITISDLHDINLAINAITDSEYKRMQFNAQEIGKKLRNGDFLCTALMKIGIENYLIHK